jgi:hypothetical protein
VADSDYLTAEARAQVAWLRDQSLESASILPVPGVFAGKIVEERGAALGQFAELETSLPVGPEGI